MKTLIVFFSFTSNVRTLATAIRKELEAAGEVDFAVIEPKRVRTGLGWLARSFLPGWRAPIRPTITDVSRYDLVCLGFPKWTFACPPVNQYIRLMQPTQGKKLALFMAFGGFDQERYLRSMVRQVSRRGAVVVATLAAKRSSIRENGHLGAVRLFCCQAVEVVQQAGLPKGENTQQGGKNPRLRSGTGR
ncbi:MAG: hypothetical protein HY315_02935 [Acidobacteria bacterium]|nr:hypothetical protein [Acidobacteriota bacterium]